MTPERAAHVPTCRELSESPPGVKSAVVLTVLVVLSGCTTGPYLEDLEFVGLDGFGCSATDAANNTLRLCAVGCRSDDGWCVAHCSAEFLVAGAVIFKDERPCDTRTRQAFAYPFGDGGTVRWEIEPQREQLSASCRITVQVPELSQDWTLHSSCLEMVQEVW